MMFTETSILPTHSPISLISVLSLQTTKGGGGRIVGVAKSVRNNYQLQNYPVDGHLPM